MSFTPAASLNGFQFESKSEVGRTVWRYRPVGATAVVRFPGSRAAFKAMLAEPRQALNFYLKELDWLSDESRLQEEEACLMREIQLSQGVTLEQKKALARLRKQFNDAKVLKSTLRENPFDAEAWSRTWLA